MTVEEDVDDLLNKILKNPYDDLNWDLFVKRSKMSELDDEFYNWLYLDLHKKYKKNPQRAARYTDSVFALYLWMKGRHPNLQEIAEGMGWSLQKARAIVKIAREVGVIRRYSRNPNEFQLVYRYDLTDEFRRARMLCFLTPSQEYDGPYSYMEYTDICDFMGDDYSEWSMECALERAYDMMGDARLSKWWDKMADKLDKKRYGKRK